MSLVIEIRLRGTRSDCDQAAATLPEVFQVLSVSRPRPDRGAPTVRVFCRAELKDHKPHEEERRDGRNDHAQH